MIGNDIVDLEVARCQSNWQRKGFLDKIFTINEQRLILDAENPELLVWNLWTRKEAAYKIFNRSTQIRAFIPLLLECNVINEFEGTISINHQTYFSQTEITESSVYTVAVSERLFFSKIQVLSSEQPILKEDGIPFLMDSISNKKNPVSITHHGRFWNGITLAV
ncbi:4'-phosphopantetheinyl transferase superfamily protein [Flavobacterium sp.]|jgi:phosphopantetheinyl transferase (holo-ACP synthase)|uniref:4'-phosphopantetheinyl transferase family protein n=1 Tax=Flavobacterium sp. TaxID=239 RepID=UPI0022C382FE|nr:4'-phosphopantetheinyl transferase superfamily protein [Flavobacterium sp.]MCZ8227894.1 4'-phosphopantetheinyl transferase superfamily protein [Flavobacterium sp.]